MRSADAKSPASRNRVVPRALAWVGDLRAPPAGLADVVTTFTDSDDFLLAPDAFGFDFYVVLLAQRGVRGVDLVRLIRRRSTAGVLVLEEARTGEFALALDSGADMVLPEGASDDELSAAVSAVHRRASESGSHSVANRPWTLVEETSTLHAPDGTAIALSQSDLALVQCFAEAHGGKVERRVLVQRLWGEQAGEMENALHATVYRLRKRIEQAGQPVAPLHAVAKVGYEFRAPLVRA